MERDQARILINFGREACTFDLLEGEKVQVVSRDGVEPKGEHLELPPMTLAVLMAPMEAFENREVSARTRTPS